MNMSTLRRVRSATVICALAIAALASHPRAAGHSFLWKASNTQGAIYLIGSVHMLTTDYYPLAPALETAFNDADLLVEEADLGEMLAPTAQMQLLSRGMLPANQTLDKVISPATYALVTKHVATLGVPVEPLAHFKPWFLAMTVLALEWQRAGFDADLGLDKHFYDRAQAAGKTVQGLETTEYQISRFDEMTMPQQERLLADSLNDLDTEQANVTRLADAWKAGDAAGIEKIVLPEFENDPLMYQRLLVERNRNWLPKLEQLFTRRGRAFVVVGAAHLIGRDGLLAMLRAKGCHIEQL
jgi:uncharacterized protein YbaP (TraB family)